MQHGSFLKQTAVYNRDIQRELKGQMDDVRIYGRALSAGELLRPAGRREPVHKPF